MANVEEKAVSILAGNLNSGLSYLITTVQRAELLGIYNIRLPTFRLRPSRPHGNKQYWHSSWPFKNFQKGSF